MLYRFHCIDSKNRTFWCWSNSTIAVQITPNVAYRRYVNLSKDFSLK